MHSRRVVCSRDIRHAGAARVSAVRVRVSGSADCAGADTMRTPRPKPLCIICRTRPATLPDRCAYPDRRKRLCVECQAERLREDMREVLKLQERAEQYGKQHEERSTG